ncbi:hypothetical protein J4217_01010 [Candidatus Pacearchaeota archaeon]|nr:hypothetical protein [Candidatus Pacearchaeota archaeon]
MKDFEYFVKIGDVKKSSVNKDLAVFLIKDMQSRIRDAFKMSSNEFPKIVFENIYDALRDFCDALLALEGYKSYSHEASISYLIKKGFDISFVMQLDNFRYKRNGSKYYGEVINHAEAEEIRSFYQTNKGRIYKLLEEEGLI